MASVRNAINELKEQQDKLKSEIEQLNDKIKCEQTQNYELEQTMLSLDHKAKMIQQKIALTEKQEKDKLEKIQQLRANFPDSVENPDSLSAKSQDAVMKHEQLLDELRSTQENANKNDMMFEGVYKRLIHTEQIRDRTLRRADLKEAEAERLEKGFDEVNSQMETFKFKDFEGDSDLMEKVAELQRKVDQMVTIAETSERNAIAVAKSIESTKSQIEKQRSESEKLRKEMAKMNEALAGLEP